MKRSEAFNAIVDILYKYDYDKGDGLWEGQCREQAHFILKKLEELGMTPPRYTALMRNGEKYDKDKHFGADVIDRVGWEPEDE